MKKAPVSACFHCYIGGDGDYQADGHLPPCIDLTCLR